MAIGDFDTYYSDNPWEALDKNQRQWYDPILLSNFRQRSVFAQTIPFAKSNVAVNAKTMTVTQLFEVHPDFSNLGLRQIWMPASHVDSRAIDITFNRHGGKVAYHKYDEIITYWKQNGNGGVRRILQGELGLHMVEVQDYLARNAYIDGALTSGFSMYGTGGSVTTNFATLETTHTFDPDIARDIWLGMSYRDVPMAQGDQGPTGNIICFTTPGVIYDIQGNAGWLDVMDYHNPGIALRYEVGTYKNVRFVATPRCTLWNCGTLTAQAPITSAITAGDGAADPDTTAVDGAYKTGQSGATHYIQLDSTAANWGAGSGSHMGHFAAGQVISVHVLRTSDYGVTNGVDFQDGKLHNRRIVSVDAGNYRLVLDRPIMVDFDTDLGSGVYGYVSLGRHIHASIFIAGPTGLVAGVGQAPQYHEAPPIDDFVSVYRFSWDDYMGYQLFNPEVFEVVFTAGSTRIKGQTSVQ